MYPRDRIREGMRLYAVTDDAWLDGRTLAECVEQAIAGGATFVQLRDKRASTEELVATAEALVPLCRKAGVPFVVNDDVEAAIAADADGVHVGQDDMACTSARAALGSGKIVGVSVQTLEEALEAEAAGADYLGVGAMFGGRRGLRRTQTHMRGSRHPGCGHRRPQRVDGTRAGRLRR